MAVHKLSILVEALGAAKASKELKSLDKAMSGIGKTGKGLAVGGLAVGAVVAGAAFTGLAKAVVSGSEALRDDARISAQTAAVLKSTGGAAGITQKAVEDLASSLSMLDGVDDNVVQGAENMLLTFTKVGRDIFPDATRAALDYSVATGKDAVGAAQQLGKALEDPLKGMRLLRGMGVILTDQQQAQIKAFQKAGETASAQGVILDALRVKYGGVAQAQADADPSKRFSVAWERLEKTLASGVLPALDDVTRSLTDVFADRAVLSGAREIGKGLGDAAKGALAFAKSVPWDKVRDGLGAAAGFAKSLVQAFTSMPPEVQGILIGLAGLNKLSGGAVTGIASELAKGAIKGVLGMTAGVVNINAGVVNGGGLGDIVGKAAGAGGVSLGAGLVATGALAAGGAAVYGLGQLGKANQEPGGANINVNALAGQAQAGFATAWAAGSEKIAAKLDSQASQIVDLSRATRDAGYELDNTIKQSWKDAAGKIVKPLDALHLDFAKQLGVLKRSADPAAVAAAAARAEKDVEKGVGSVSGTKSLLATLKRDRALVAGSGDKKLLAQIDSAIRRVHDKIAPRQWVASQLDQARKIAGSTESSAKKAEQLKAIEQRLKSDGALHAAQQVAAIRANTAATKAKLSVTVESHTAVWVTAGGIKRTVSIGARYGKTVGSYGGGDFAKGGK